MTPTEESSGPRAPLIGVVASPHSVEAQLVERTPFGRFRSAGRRVVEDVDGPSEFYPLPYRRQLAGAGAAPDETRAGKAWVETVANAIAKLTFGLRGGPPVVGVAVEARLDGAGRSVEAARGGPRVDDFAGLLTAALRGRNLDPAAPVGRLLSMGEAATLGEMESALGGLAGSTEALSLEWGQDVSWTRVSRGHMVLTSLEPVGAAHDLGLDRLDHHLQAAAPSEAAIAPLFVRARRGDPVVNRMLAKISRTLGAEAGRRLLEWPSADESRHPDPPPAAGRVLVGGVVGRLAMDPRLREVLHDPFQAGLARALFDREDASRSRGFLVPDGGPLSVSGSQLESESVSGGSVPGGRLVLDPGLLHFSQEHSAAVIGAAASVAPKSSSAP